MQTTIISFVRHGEVYNPHNICYGRLPRYRLSENGRNQAAATSQILQSQGVTAVYSSPMLRARQTARIIREMLGLPMVHRSANLIESYYPFEGQPCAVVAARGWDVYTGSPPEYEQPGDIVARMTKFIRLARRKHGGGHIIAVSHGDPIAFTALWAAGLPLTVKDSHRLGRIGLADDYPGHAAVLSLSFNEEGERPYQIEYRCPTRESVKNSAG